MTNRNDQESGPLTEQLTQCGVRLRELRSARGWTLEELAERSGLSKPFLSRLEAGDRRPSIAAVLTLARIYGVPVGALFDSPGASSPCIIVRGKEAPLHRGDGLSYVSLSSQERFTNLQPIRLTISANRKGDERFQHDGEEWVYVLAGRVQLAIGDQTHELATGDAAHFDSRLPHRLTAIGKADAEVLVVACPLPEPSGPEPGRRVRSKRAIR